MEAHPIPQNVTSFQFKLVGDMTLKQFLYLAVGTGTAYVIFILFARDYPIIAWPLIVISAGLGAAFAFLPIGSRPLDYWLVAFLKAIYSPTKLVWRKNDKTFKEDLSFQNRLVMYLAANQQISKSAVPASQPIIANIPTAAIPTTTSSPASTMTHQSTETPVSIQPLPSQEELKKTVELARQAQQLQMKIIQTERTLAQIKNQARQPAPIPINFSQQVNKILNDLQILINQASEVKQQLESIQAPETKLETTPAMLKEKVKIVIPSKPQQKQMALTTFPNVINGVVKDKENNYLSGVVAVIYDKEGLPMRALKTNKLGQFTGSTPLPNGTYTLEMEKDNYTFDVLQMELTGGVLPPLMITAK